MLRFTKAITATALGLVISLSLCTPGAFAQNVQQGTNNNTTVTQTIGHGNNYQDNGGPNNNHRGNNYQDNGGPNNHYRNDRFRRVRCTRRVRWVRTRHGARRVWYQFCRRY